MDTIFGFLAIGVILLIIFYLDEFVKDPWQFKEKYIDKQTPKTFLLSSIAGIFGAIFGLLLVVGILYIIGTIFFIKPQLNI